MKIDLPKQVNNAIKMLNLSGFEAYAVGGAIRDSLLGIIPYDWDITTNAEPSETKQIFNDSMIIETGIKHGTVTVIFDGMPLEITTYRVDGDYKDSRHPEKVTFSKNLKDDLSRRDFTINTLCYNQKEGLVDLFGGANDIDNGIIKSVGSPDKRFNEDALRIMRAIRFSATLGFEIDKETEKNIFANRQLLTNISVERIRAEFDKLITGKNATDIIRKYHSVIEVFIPELNALIGCEQHTKYHIYDVFEHTLHAVDEIDSNDIILRLTMLFHDFGKPFVKTTDEYGTSHFKGHGKISAELTEKILGRLKYDNKTIKAVTKLVLIHDLKSPVTKQAAKHMLYSLGDEQYLSLIKIKRADNRAKANPHGIDEKLDIMMKFYLEIKGNNECYTLKDLNVNGYDLRKCKISNDTSYKTVLEFLLNAVIDENCLNNKNDLISYYKKYFNSDNF